MELYVKFVFSVRLCCEEDRQRHLVDLILQLLDLAHVRVFVGQDG